MITWEQFQEYKAEALKEPEAYDLYVSGYINVESSKYHIPLDLYDLPFLDLKQVLKELKIKLVGWRGHEIFPDDANRLLGYAVCPDPSLNIYPEIAVAKDIPFMLSCLFHEIAHALLHPCGSNLTMSYETREVEAELVAFCCTKYLNLPGQKGSKAYIHKHLNLHSSTQWRRKEVFEAVNKILTAGKVSDSLIAA